MDNPKHPPVDDYGQHLAKVPKQLNQLTKRLAVGKYEAARTIATDIRDSLDKVIAWADARIEKKPIPAPAAWPFPITSDQTLCGKCFDRFPKGTEHTCKKE